MTQRRLQAIHQQYITSLDAVAAPWAIILEVKTDGDDEWNTVKEKMQLLRWKRRGSDREIGEKRILWRYSDGSRESSLNGEAVKPTWRLNGRQE